MKLQTSNIAFFAAEQQFRSSSGDGIDQILGRPADRQWYHTQTSKAESLVDREKRRRTKQDTGTQEKIIETLMGLCIFGTKI